MAKAQKSKRARKHRKQAKFSKLKGNTAHPSHLKERDVHAKRRYLEKNFE